MNVLSTAWTVVKTVAVTHAPLIFIGAAAVGVVSTAVIAWKAGKKSSKVLGQAKYDKGSDLTRFEKVKATWKLWLPMVVSIILTFGCMAASYYIHSVRLAEMTATANALLASNKDLQKQLDEIEELAPEAVEEVKKHRLQELGERTLETYDNMPGTIYKTGYGNDIFVDAFTGIKFMSSLDEVLKGIAMFQKAYKDSTGGVFLEDLYKYWHVSCGGMMLPVCGWPKACRSDIDKYTVPDIDVEYQSCRVTDKETGEESCEDRGCYIISYLVCGVSPDHIFDNVDPWVPEREVLRRYEEEYPDGSIDADILASFAP